MFIVSESQQPTTSTHTVTMCFYFIFIGIWLVFAISMKYDIWIIENVKHSDSTESCDFVDRIHHKIR